jgi:poly(glycerol-phosphate) alpha-glucosyltransferase
VATLTQGQSDALCAAQLSSCSNIATLPNWLTVEPVAKIGERFSRRGVVVGRLAREKRFEHCLEALANTLPGYEDVTLDVLGEGRERQALEERAAALGVQDRVSFEGYSPNAREEFRNYSFSLLTSETEGQPLVLLESMAGGCIPIAYNIDYGPGDIITDGVDGFLVEPGDICGVSRRIEQIASMPDESVLRMREAAVARSRDFSRDRIMDEWAKQLKFAVERRRGRGKPGATVAQVGGARLKSGGMNLRLRVPAELRDADVVWAKISWIQRGTNIYGRVPARLEEYDGRLIARARVLLEHFAPARDHSSRLLDVFLDVGNATDTFRLDLGVDGSFVDVESGGYRLFSTSRETLCMSVPANPGS